MNLLTLMFLTVLYYCNHSTDAFTLKGAVLPQGNYRIFVRTVPATEVKDINNNFNALKTLEKDSDELLGNGTIANGTKFEIDLVLKLLGSNDSVVEIDTNGNFEIELKFKQPLVYEADRLSQKNYYLDFESSLKVEPLNPKLFTIEDPNLLLISGNTIGVQIHFMESRIETEINRSVLCSSEMKKDQKNVIIIRGNVVNLPDIDCAWKIKVELFKSEPRANSSQQLSLISVSEKTVDNNNIFEFIIKSDKLRIKKPVLEELFSISNKNKFGPIHLMVTPVASPKPKKFQHILTYPTLAPKSNEPDNSYRYNFGKIDYSESAMAKEKESMVQLYNAYLNKAKAKSTYNMVNSVVENVVAYKLSLQMVRMRMIKDIKE
ncbi:hypothetical protein GPALN_010154 [Globodera pallida]|nr:hypothetical protein GPALN_010154 [Globodera pallida]